ncbi:hypothetical protein V6N11_019161 [Hibiscus sabdariffa]|uniref:hAT-like transposase RNase-H fold domain-containing protein n=1 Tax=Hibiscus sabdariffa TaxID=183260 RepID=A0ABR2R214_9ROSI
MLKSALVFMRPFRNMKTKCSPNTKELRKVGGPLDDVDWDKVTVFLLFLEIFYDATLSFSGSRYVTVNNFVEEIFDIGYTINCYLDDSNFTINFYDATLSFSGSRYVTVNNFVEEIFDIGYTINCYLGDSNSGLRSMASQMKMKFDKYWANVNSVNVLMFIALVLELMHKLRYVEWIVHHYYDPSNSFILCQRIKDTLTSLFDFYASSQPSAPQMKSRSMGDVGHGDGGIRKLKGINLRKDFVTEIKLFDTFEATELDKLEEALICTQHWICASLDTIIIEEILLTLENIEEEMQDLTSEQPTIIIYETNEVADDDVMYEESCP